MEYAAARVHTIARRGCVICMTVQSARLRDMHNCTAYATARSSRLHDLHDCAIRMSAWPARLRDLRDCKSARLRHSSRPPTFAATPRLRCINIRRTPVVDWIGFQRLIPNPVRTAVRRSTRPQTAANRERRNSGLSNPAHQLRSGTHHQFRRNPRFKSNLAPQSPNWSTGNGHCGRRFQPRPHENSGIPRFVDYHRPAAQPGTHRFQCSPRTESDIGVQFPNQSMETDSPAD